MKIIYITAVSVSICFISSYASDRDVNPTPLVKFVVDYVARPAAHTLANAGAQVVELVMENPAQAMHAATAFVVAVIHLRVINSLLNRFPSDQSAQTLHDRVQEALTHS